MSIENFEKVKVKITYYDGSCKEFDIWIIREYQVNPDEYYDNPNDFHGLRPYYTGDIGISSEIDINYDEIDSIEIIETGEKYNKNKIKRVIRIF